MASQQPPRRPFVSYPPVGSVVRLYYALTLAARLSLWFLKYAILRFRRPHSSWSLWQTISTRLAKHLVHARSITEQPTRLTLKPGKEKERFVTIEPADKSLYRGPLESKTSPASIGATWYPKSYQTGSELGPDAIVFLHMHGGAFVIGDGRTAASGFGASSLIHNAGATAVMAPQYRLSSRPDPQPFPAALQDTLTSYLHLIRTLGIPASNIVVSGDSAGGNLVIGLLRYLAEHGESLDIPPPRNAVLFSPWVDVAQCLTRSGRKNLAITTNPNFDADYLPESFVRWGAKEYCRGVVAVTDPWVTPIGNPFATPVPIFVNIATAELLEVEDTRWVKEMSLTGENQVHTNYEANAPHDTILVGDTIGWAESAHAVSRQIGLFLKRTKTQE